MIEIKLIRDGIYQLLVDGTYICSGTLTDLANIADRLKTKYKNY